MTTPRGRDERDLRLVVQDQLGLKYDPFDVQGAIDSIEEAAVTAPKPDGDGDALAVAERLLDQALPLAKRYADALVQLQLELDSTDLVEDEYRAGLETALKIVRGLP